MILQLPEIVNETILDTAHFINLDYNHSMGEKNQVDGQ